MPSWRKSIPPFGPFFVSSPPPPGSPPPPPIDLSRVTEATRRALYDAVVAIHFSPTLEEVRAAREADEWYPRYSADESRLAVFHFAGRWLAIWRQWDAGDDAPEDQEWEMLRVEANPAMPYGVELYEV
ncbi:MAG TPA: hypothetical protein VFE33_18610 [Thermoanaerobaculia bacterium]|nr:hypothetical protein [Thermoanaerobaculia bacterium]